MPDRPPAQTTPLYQALVLDHQRAPRCHGPVAGHTHAAESVNALCGDRVRIELCLADDCVGAIGFTGEACAITTATASMLCELAIGRTVSELADLERRFHEVIAGDVAEDAVLGSLNALRELARYPSRRLCAELPWNALHAALTHPTESARS